MMNISDIKRSIGRGGLYLRKYSPEILLGTGLIGVVATVVMASKATLKVEALVEETVLITTKINDAGELGKTSDGRPYSAEDHQKDLAVHYIQTGLKFAKLYGPAVGVGILSLTAILASHGIMAQRQVALIAAYNLLHEGYQAYRHRVVDELGEDVDRNYYLGLSDEVYKETVVDEDGNKTKTKKTVKIRSGRPLSMYARCYDKGNTQYRGDRIMDRAFLMGQQRYANDKLLLHGHVFLNEVYESLGFPHTKEGQLVGWVLRGDPRQMEDEGRDGYISFGLDLPSMPTADREFMDGENDAIWLEFNVDGVVYQLI